MDKICHIAYRFIISLYIWVGGSVDYYDNDDDDDYKDDVR